MRVVGPPKPGGGFVVLGTCRDFDPPLRPGQVVEAREPIPEAGEDPIWGPTHFRILRWPVTLLLPSGEVVVQADERHPDPAKLPGWAPAVTLTADERDLLEWLSREDESQYGECHGPELDSLVAKGLAQVGDERSGLVNSFIAKGRGIMFRAVTLTEAGRAIAAAARG